MAAGRFTQSILNKDFGDSVAVMLTLSSPPVSYLEIKLRARNIREAIETHREQTPTTMPAKRWTGVLVYPSTVARSYVVRMGQTLAQCLTEAGVARDVAIVEAPSAGMLDVTLNPGKTRDDLQKEIDRWERQAVGADEFDPDVWRPFWIKDLGSLESELHRNARDKYSYRELKDFADRIRDRLKQSHYARIDMVGNQDEQVWLSYSGQRLNQFRHHAAVDRGSRAGTEHQHPRRPGRALPRTSSSGRPVNTLPPAEIGHTVMDVLAGIRPVPARPGGSRAGTKTRPT